MTSLRFGELLAGKEVVSVSCSGGFNGLRVLAAGRWQATANKRVEASRIAVNGYRFIKRIFRSAGTEYFVLFRRRTCPAVPVTAQVRSLNEVHSPGWALFNQSFFP